MTEETGIGLILYRLDEMNARLDAIIRDTVPVDVYELKHSHLEKRVSHIEENSANARTVRVMMIVACISPMATVLIDLVMGK